MASLANVERFGVLSQLKMLQCFEWIQLVGLFELAPMRAAAKTWIQELVGTKASVSVELFKGV
jgi:hypothetical protein